jgi:aminopeptidase N
MEGRELLSETLAQYSAQMVVKKLRGRDYLRRYLQYELDRYLEGRGNNGGAEEPTLTRVNGQDYVTYRKGALAMYLVQERLGEAAVNHALQGLLKQYRFKGAPYPRSLDLVAALRAEAKTTEERALITDLFERITLYDLKVTEPTAVRRADGRWDVTVPIEAKKFYVDARSVESEAAVDESIEVGLFTAEPGRDAFDAKNVILMDRRPIHSGAQVLTFVTARRPTHAGVDPYNYYIDRNSSDNVRPVQ